jgi:hypothetical protein
MVVRNGKKMKTAKTFRTEQEASIYSLSLKEIGIESTVLKIMVGLIQRLRIFMGIQ